MTDFNKAIEKTKSLREEKYSDELVNKPLLVLSYYKDIIKLCNEKVLSIEEASYLIADTMWYKAVENNQKIEEVALEAGELELPEHLVSGNQLDRWKNLIQDIQGLYETFRKK